MSIKKRLLFYGLLGFLIGPFISTLIALGLSYANADQWGWIFSPVVPSFAKLIGNQLNAYTVQFLLNGVMGAGFAMAAIIWQVERWDFTKQCILHFLALSVIMFPIAYFLQWMPHTLAGFLLYAAIFVAIYFICWCVYTLYIRIKIKKMNQQLKNKQR